MTGGSPAHIWREKSVRLKMETQVCVACGVEPVSPRSRKSGACPNCDTKVVTDVYGVKTRIFGERWRDINKIDQILWQPEIDIRAVNLESQAVGCR